MVDLSKPSEVLAKAADLIEPEGAWTQEVMATTSDGASVGTRDPQAACFCILGAIAHVTASQEQFLSARRLLQRVRDLHMVSPWNDAPDRTQAEVVKALRDAADLARSEGQ